MTTKKLIKGYLIFLAVWTIRILLLDTYINEFFFLWSKEIINGMIKCIIWFGFAFWFIKKYGSQFIIKKQQMLRFPAAHRAFLPAVGFISLYFLLAMLVFHKGFYFNLHIHPSKFLGTVIFAGIIEEILFRGCLLNGLWVVASERKANIITSVCFVIVHYPKYLIGGTPGLILLNSFGIFIAGLVFGWSFQKSKSLWVPILLHMFWNVLSITML